LVTSVAYSPDGKHIVGGARDMTVKTWDSATGEEVSHRVLPIIHLCFICCCVHYI
jgi:WD40 repeat protein